MVTKNARRTASQSTETAAAATAVVEAPTTPIVEVTPEFDMSEFNAAMAEANRQLAAKAKVFRDENADKLSAEQKAMLAGLARGYTRIANDLSKTDN